MALPWAARRRLLERVLGYELAASSHMGLAWIAPHQLVLGPDTSIGHGTVCRNIGCLELGRSTVIGSFNWITGTPPESTNSPGYFSFSHQLDRYPRLLVGEHSSVTSRHVIDCTNEVSIGRFSVVAGYHTLILTHSVDLEHARQASEPVQIGNFCFVGSRCTLLPGSALPDYSVLGAGSLLNKSYEEPYVLYAGSPARPVKSLPPQSAYFMRKTGHIS